MRRLSPGLGLAASEIRRGCRTRQSAGLQSIFGLLVPRATTARRGQVVGDWDSGACRNYHFSDENYPPGPHMQAEPARQRVTPVRRHRPLTVCGSPATVVGY